MKKKTIIILIAALVLVVVLVIVGVSYLSKRPAAEPTVSTGATLTPKFLNDAEVTGLGLPSGTKVQALERGPAGEVMIYKVIRSDKDIVDPARVGPISPRAVKR